MKKRAFTCMWILLGALGLAAAPQEQPFTVTGITKPYRDETLSFSVPGTIETVHVEEGDHVRSGETLVELDSKLEQLEVARRKLVWESRVELKAAKAKVALTLADLEATQSLFDSTKSVSREELENKRMEHTIASAEADQLEVAEKREEIEYQMAAVQLDRRSLRAPLEGIVVKVLLREGENCEPRQPVLRIVEVSKAYFVANVEAGVARLLKPGTVVPLAIGTGNEPIRVDGKVSYIAPVVDPASGLQEVKILFENPEGTIRPGVAGVAYIGQARDE